MTQLTKLQMRVFEFICRFIETEGLPPAYSDISAHFNFSSDGTVRTYLEQLERKGYIQRLGRARGIKILKPLQPPSIPIVGKIAAGTPQVAVEDHHGTLNDISELDAQDGRIALKVRGDSMKDVGILDGDLAIIQTNIPIYNGQIAAISIDNEATLKRVYFEGEKVRLQPENEYYKPLYVTRKDFDTQTIGRYIALVRKV